MVKPLVFVGDSANTHIRTLQTQIPALDVLLLESAEEAERDALFDTEAPCRARYHRPCRAGVQMHCHLGPKLISLGFRYEDLNNQQRYRSDELGIRLIFARAQRISDDGTFELSRKGRQTRDLIRDNAILLGYDASPRRWQASLFPQYGDELSLRQTLNMWVLVEPHGTREIAVYMALPIIINQARTVIQSAEWDTVGTVSVSNDISLAYDEAPPAETVDFDIESRKVENQ